MGSGQRRVCALEVRKRRLTGPGAASLEDILQDTLLPGSLAAPPVTAVAHTRARRALPRCPGHGGANSARELHCRIDWRAVGEFREGRLRRSRREAGGAASEPVGRVGFLMPSSAAAPGPAR
jgi:hypothetical protein